ncbi:hypothetical protein FGG08_002141 [Glutinoglossum americanum]|uniref:Structure-specific endonuclease subunit SLX4 n=1 Tax=Glutinoglossum americanum TaxID=1670608 RepID=A0A9P8L211_9PEZI|nr:hypothetical protein FGG08_002141 [Glutinoglossum americanum]
MATSLVVLLSSPPRSPLGTVSISSSPCLPSPSVLIQRARLTESPRASLLARNAIVGFKSATVLLQDEATRRDREGKPKAIKVTGQEVGNRGSSRGGKKTTKKGASMGKTEEQARIAPMKVTKVVRDTTTGKLGGRQLASREDLLAHKHPIPFTIDSGVIGEATNGDHDLLFNGAMRRRIDWTPPKNTVPTIDLSMAPSLSPISREDDLTGPAASGSIGKSFKDFVGRFGYEGGELSTHTAVPRRQLVDSGTRKRQWVELVDPPSAVAPTNMNEYIDGVALAGTASAEMVAKETLSVELTPLMAVGIAQEQAFRGGPAKKRAATKKTPTENVSKERAPRKKPKTITEQATMPYGVRSPPPAPVLQREEAEAHNDVGVEVTVVKTAPPPKRSRKARPAQAGSGSSKARPTPRRKKAKESDPSPTLLSPRSAFKKMDEQVVLFGTSSQLAREGSPSPALPMPLGQVIPQLEPKEAMVSIGDISRDHTLPYSSATCGLWSAASRDLNGSLMEIDVVDLASTPKARNGVVEAARLVIPVWSQKPPEAATPLENCSEDWVHAGDGNGPAMDLEYVSGLQPDSAHSRNSDPFTEADQTKLAGPGSSQIQLLPDKELGSAVATDVYSLVRGHPTLAEPASTRPQMPDYTGYPTSQLSSELVLYGFKPVKGRKKMIELLEKCWEGKNKMTLATPGIPERRTNIPISGGIENARSVGRGELVAGEPCHSVKTKQTASVGSGESVLKKPGGRSKAPTLASIVLVGGLTQASTKISECRSQGELLTGLGNISSPKRPRGRPKKNVLIGNTGLLQKGARRRGVEAAKTAKQKILSNTDSDQETDNLNKVALSSAPYTPSTADSSSKTSAVPTPTLPDEAKQQRRFDYISRAVTSQPSPENASSMPSFHQKILMYDPIVLEDLTAWLNTKGLADIGVDTEVGAAEVRAWCERNSICCLWKDPLWGRIKSRCR